MNGITVSFCGVNEIYQLALAAQEAGYLDAFYCSIFDAPGKWGRTLARVLGDAALTNRRLVGLNPDLAHEFPWPFLFEKLAKKVRLTKNRFHWTEFNYQFDAWASENLKKSQSQIIVGTETCARDSFRTAKKAGMRTVLDCPQVHPSFLQHMLEQAADHLNLPPPPPVDTAKMAARKTEEFAMADVLIVPSEVSRKSFLQAGVSSEKLTKVPLWSDPAIWYPGPPKTDRCPSQPLRALFIGRTDLRKGIPYLLDGVYKCGSRVHLTLVGEIASEMKPVLNKYSGHFSYLKPTSKPQLRKILWRSDVLVLPSLVDSFGFVAMEAMACGIPVIVSENCGVPTPDASWRIPTANSDAIAERLMNYAIAPDLCREHGIQALSFARQFTPTSYRTGVICIFNSLMQPQSSDAGKL